MFNNAPKIIALALLAVFAAAAQAKTVEIEGMDSLKFSKEEISVKAGEEVTVKLSNNTELPAAAMAHNFVLLVADAEPEAVNEAAASASSNDYIPESMSDQIVAHTGIVAGGESDSVTFTAPSEPGTYTYICTFPGHFAGGMMGKLVVQ